MSSPSPVIQPIFSQPFQQYTYLAYFADRQDCLVIDPGLEPNKIVDAITRLERTPAAILCTHGHADHIAGNAALKERWPACPLVIGAGDQDKLSDPVANLSAGFGGKLHSPPADQLVQEGDILEWAGFRWEVRETPGHSSGHVVYVSQQLQPTLVFGGDVLFAGSVGRTDFPGCSFDVLKQSITEKLYSLDDDTRIYPGHGPPTTIGEEKSQNPYVGLSSTFQS